MPVIVRFRQELLPGHKLVPGEQTDFLHGFPQELHQPRILLRQGLVIFQKLQGFRELRPVGQLPDLTAQKARGLGAPAPGLLRRCGDAVHGENAHGMIVVMTGSVGFPDDLQGFFTIHLDHSLPLDKKIVSACKRKTSRRSMQGSDTGNACMVCGLNIRKAGFLPAQFPAGGGQCP